MEQKKATSSRRGQFNSILVLSIFAFYAFLFVLFGLIGLTHDNSLPALGEPSLLGFLSQIGNFTSAIFYTLSFIPAWANTLLFFPFAVTLFYIAISFLRGSG